MCIGAKLRVETEAIDKEAIPNEKLSYDQQEREKKKPRKAANVPTRKRRMHFEKKRFLDDLNVAKLGEKEADKQFQQDHPDVKWNTFRAWKLHVPAKREGINLESKT